MRVGLVLAAGGSVGVAYHGAVLAALEEHTGWDPRRAALVVGTSAGSVTGAVLRAGVPARDLACISEGRPLSAEGSALAAVGRPRRPRPSAHDTLAFRPMADFRAVLHGVTHPWAHPRAALIAAALPAGGIPTTAISAGIDAVYAGRWPDDPLWICAVDLRSGRRVVFGRDEHPAATVGLAVGASAAIPMYFKPVTIGGRRYVDGGVHSMTNLDVAAGADLDLVIVVSPLTYAARWPALAPASLVREPLRARLAAEMSVLRRTGVPVVAVHPGRAVVSAMGLNPMDAARRGAVSRATRQGVRRWLTEGLDGRRLSRALCDAARADGGPVARPGA